MRAILHGWHLTDEVGVPRPPFVLYRYSSGPVISGAPGERPPARTVEERRFVLRSVAFGTAHYYEEGRAIRRMVNGSDRPVPPCCADGPCSEAVWAEELKRRGSEGW